MEKQKIVLIIVLLAFVGVMFRYEIIQSPRGAYVLNRWTGGIQFIIMDERLPVKDHEK